MRKMLVVGCLVVTFSACSGGGVSLTEYAETLEALTSVMIEQLEVGDVQMATGAPTIEDAREVLTGAPDIRLEFQDALTDLDPPEEMADLHGDLVDLHARIITAQQTLAARAETATTLEELEQSEELTAYRVTQADAVTVCRELQARIDATADRDIFVDTPWIPGDLKEVVEVTFGC
jgi:hypothetical protein